MDKKLKQLDLRSAAKRASNLAHLESDTTEIAFSDGEQSVAQGQVCIKCHYFSKNRLLVQDRRSK